MMAMAEVNVAASLNSFVLITRFSYGPNKDINFYDAGVRTQDT